MQIRTALLTATIAAIMLALSSAKLPAQPAQPAQPAPPADNPPAKSAPPAIADLIDKLAADADPLARLRAIHDLRTRGPRAMPALAALHHLAATAADELVREQAARAVRAIDRPLGVLFVENQPRYEFRFLNEFLQRQLTWRYHGWLDSADRTWPQPHTGMKPWPDTDAAPARELGMQSLTVLPPAASEADRQEFYDRYDVVILGDIDAAKLGADFIAMLEIFVRERGGSVIFLAGENCNPASYRGTLLADLLPVELPAENADLSRAEPLTHVAKKFHLTDAGRIHPMLQLADDPAASAAKWRDARGFFWFLPIPRAKVAATVLLEHPGIVEWVADGTEMSRTITTPDGGRYPLIARLAVGKGNTLFIATDDLWYLRSGTTGVPAYHRLWQQIITHSAAARRAE